MEKFIKIFSAIHCFAFQCCINLSLDLVNSKSRLKIHEFMFSSWTPLNSKFAY